MTSAESLPGPAAGAHDASQGAFRARVAARERSCITDRSSGCGLRGGGGGAVRGAAGAASPGLLQGMQT